MPKKPLIAEEIAKLRSGPYIAKIKDDRITFTPKFKRMVYDGITSEKYALIREATLRDNNLLKISKMCKIAGVSRSGYYNRCAAEWSLKVRDDAD